MREELRSRARAEGLSNVFLPGRVSEELPLYYRASDVMVLPGRGGMVISEAMAYALPVIVFQADGTEHDLVLDGKTGIHLKHGHSDEIGQAIEYLSANPEKAQDWGMRGEQLLRERFTTENMVNAMMKAVHAAKKKRSRFTETTVKTNSSKRKCCIG